MSRISKTLMIVALFAAVVDVVLQGHCLAAPAPAQTKSAVTNKTICKMVFPTAYSVGDFYLLTDQDPSKLLTNADEVQRHRGKFLGLAKGTVSITRVPNEYIYFYPSYDAVKHPESFRIIAPNAIDCLSFGFIPLEMPIEDTLEPISHITGLRRIEINAAELKDPQITPLARLPQLESLCLVGNNLTGESLKNFACRDRLKALDLSLNQLTFAGFCNLTQFKNLVDLKVRRCGATDSAITEISKLKNLAVLELDLSNITAGSLTVLRAMPHLKVLDIIGTKFTPTELMALKGGHLRLLKVLARFYTPRELSTLSTELKPTKISASHGQQSVDTDTKDLFAPLH